MLKKAVYYITHWEEWHWLAKYFVIGPVWFWLCLKARSLWFFTPSNPTITFGGFTGEAKSEIYRQLPSDIYPLTAFISPSADFDEVVAQMKSTGLSLPLAVKPDIGMMGYMFRRIESLEQLRQYHETMPVDYLLQRWIDFPLEVSVFYYRHPGSQKGIITGLVKKEYMEVVGNGRSTLGELIENYPRAQFRIQELTSKHAGKIHNIIPDGETFCLSHALNLSRGGKLVGLEQEIDERLLKVFDGLSHHAGNFFYGRYDIKCSSIEDLKSGRNFSILEYNGCGAEAHHVYGGGYSFFKACKVLVQHWNILYEISAQNHLRGVVPWTHQQGMAFIKKAYKHNQLLSHLDKSFSFEIKQTAEVHGLRHQSQSWRPLARQKATA